MRSRTYLNAVMLLAVLTGLVGQEQRSAPASGANTQFPLPPAYRILQLVSAGGIEQKINEAAAAGYRFFMLQPTPAAGGITVVMKKREADSRYE